MDIGMITGNRTASPSKFRLLTNAGNFIKTAPGYCAKSLQTQAQSRFSGYYRRFLQMLLVAE
jgi:hypothetical protein